MKLKLKNDELFVRKVVTGEIVRAEVGRPLVAVVSTDAIDSYGDIIHQGPSDKGAGWRLERFNNAPRIFWLHNPERPNLGKGRAWLEENRLLVEVAFDMKDAFAADLDRKYREGYLSEWSVGFRALKREPRGEGYGGEHFWEQVLLENSAVNRGANPETDTISKAMLSGLPVDDIDECETSEIALLKAELQDYRAELEARVRAIESHIMRQTRESEERAEELRRREAEEAQAIIGRMNETLDKIVAKQ